MSSDHSAIYDRGYQRYQGTRLGRGYLAGTLFTDGLRTAFGLGRGARAKIFPWLVVATVGAAAVAVAVLNTRSAEPELTYPEFVDYLGLLVALFLAITAPELVSRDLRTRILTLYFSRPVRRTDYPLARLGALVAATWLLLGAPILVMLTGAVFTSASPREAGRELLAATLGVAYAGGFALVSAGIALLVASLFIRRAVAAAAIAGVFLLTIPVAGVLSVSSVETVRQLAGLVSPSLILQGIHGWLLETGYGLDIGQFGPVYGAAALATVVASAALLMLRFRRITC